VAAGGTLLAASVIVLSIRSVEISKLHRDCPGGLCPEGSNRGDLESTRDRALVEGPLAIALGAAGALATAAGAYFLVTPVGGPSTARGAHAHLVPFLAPESKGIAIEGTFR
jgi:hypothetical protein